MAFEDQISNPSKQSKVNSDLLRKAVGRRLTGIRRYILGLGTSNDEWGHGITELEFDQFLLVIRPGPNEDFILVEREALIELDAAFWTPVEARQIRAWSNFLGKRLISIDLYTDGTYDVAYVFHFGNGSSFSIVLYDTDLSMAQDLNDFDHTFDQAKPRLRERL